MWNTKTKVNFTKGARFLICEQKWKIVFSCSVAPLVNIKIVPLLHIQLYHYIAVVHNIFCDCFRNFTKNTEKTFL